jgi:hypothetical protein
VKQHNYYINKFICTERKREKERKREQEERTGRRTKGRKVDKHRCRYSYTYKDFL